MAKLIDIVRFLNSELDIKKYNHKDYCKNGLQYRAKKSGKNNEISKIGFAVDASVSTFELAKKSGCDLLITHHAVYGKVEKYPEISKLKIKWLNSNDLSVYCSHAPLDAHKKYGNCAVILQLLGIVGYRPFGDIKGIVWGQAGRLKSPKDTRTIARELEKKIPTKTNNFLFGKEKVVTIAAVSGSGSNCYQELLKKKMDLLIVGDINYSHAVNAKDLKINIIAARHYNTETLGVKALMPLLRKKFNVKTAFIENDTGI